MFQVEKCHASPIKLGVKIETCSETIFWLFLFFLLNKIVVWELWWKVEHIVKWDRPKILGPIKLIDTQTPLPSMSGLYHLSRCTMFWNVCKNNYPVFLQLLRWTKFLFEVSGITFFLENFFILNKSEKLVQKRYPPEIQLRILTRAMWATSQNSVATQERSYIRLRPS